MKLVLIFSLLITSVFAQTRQDIVDEGNRLIDNAHYSSADQRTRARVIKLVQRANLLLEQDSTPNDGKNCSISGGNSWLYINVDGNRVHSIYNNGNEALSKIQSLNCKRNSINITFSSSNSWSYLRADGVNLFSFYNNGDHLMSALESVMEIRAFNVDLKDVTFSSSNSWLYLRISGSTLYSFYNNSDIALLKIEQYPILRRLIKKEHCKITQSNSWSNVYFGDSLFYSFYNNWTQADQKLRRLKNLGVCK